MNGPKVIIALDPGGTTGIAFWFRNSTTFNPEVTSISQWQWGRLQVNGCDIDAGLIGLMRELTAIVGRTPTAAGRERPVHIAYESFDFRHEERERDRIDYTPAEVIGAVRLWAAGLPYVNLVKYNAATGKGFWSDDKIKKLGLWVPGYKHAMDATRHLLYYMAFQLDMTELFYPLRPDPMDPGN